MRIDELQKKYDLEFEKVEGEIKKSKAKSVLIQLPDGLKPYATEIVNHLEQKIPNVSFKIWLGTCFGACDLPTSKSDLIIQFGHAPWKEN